MSDGSTDPSPQSGSPQSAITQSVITEVASVPAGTSTVSWVKGHGTLNDFVLLDDPDGQVFGDLDPELVRHLCDRRAGVGADGVLRVIHPEALADVPAADGAQWFMDYRNSDGSVAEMCGNGVRVFAQYLLATGRAVPGAPVTIGTRAGLRTAHPVAPPGRSGALVPSALTSVPTSAGDRVPAATGPGPHDPASGWWSVDMGIADLAVHRSERSPLSVAVDGDPNLRAAVGVDVGNPHAVVFVEDVADAGPLVFAPQVTPPGVFTGGVNVEFVVRTGPAGFRMRVHERGAGETPSCGTGICAAAAALHAAVGATGAVTWDVEVRGGRLTAEVVPAGTDRFRVVLTGPAVLVGEGRLTR